ncbi:hypothetical protein MHYP_G00260490 [Metynnis hypsauchen]
MIPKTDWMKKIDADDLDYWNRYTQILQHHQEIFRVNVNILMQRFSHTEGMNTFRALNTEYQLWNNTKQTHTRVEPTPNPLKVWLEGDFRSLRCCILDSQAVVVGAVKLRGC